jgi:hypothetical protein
MPITTVAELRSAIERAEIPEEARAALLAHLSTEPDCELDDNAVRAFFWFAPAQYRQFAPAILAAGGQAVTRDRVIRLRVSAAEHAEIVRRAEDAGMTISQFLRQLAMT